MRDQVASERAIRSALSRYMDPPEDGAMVAPLWRCKWCDSQHDGEPPFEYHGCPVCSDGCEAALEELDDARLALERAVSQRNLATITALMFFLGFMLAAFGGRL